MRRNLRKIASLLLAVLVATMLSPSFAWEATERQSTHEHEIVALGEGGGAHDQDQDQDSQAVGAAEVTTCEAQPLVAATAKRIIADNGFDQGIKAIAKKSTDVMLSTDLAQPADIFVQEIFSSDLLAERVLSTIEDAKRRLLKQD